MPRQTTNIFQLFQSFSWSTFLDINEREEYIKIANTEEYILKKDQDFFIIKFYDYQQSSNSLLARENYITLNIHKNLNVLDFINYWANEDRNTFGYNFNGINIFKKIISGVSNIKVSSEYRNEIQIRGVSLLIKPEKLNELQNESNLINKKVSSSKFSLLNYLVNQAKFTFLNKRTKRTTSSVKGDFEFLIHRFNLMTKNEKKDFLNYLSEDDVNSLGLLFDGMIKKEVFNKDYLKKLDEYFIKEKLDKIIKNGKEILLLKKDDINSQEAKELIRRLFNDNIGQLETVWQRFFENYLLYLFFSYKKIIPKVELKDLDNLDKKYPDFIGVNHYDGIDVIEIKTHLKNILVWDGSHNNFAFSSEMSKAIIQTINYMDAISDDKIRKSKNKKDLLAYLNIDENLYRPKGIIIISSLSKICKNQNKLSENQKKLLIKDFTKLRNSISNIQVFTFDEILSIAERYTENFKN